MAPRKKPDLRRYRLVTVSATFRIYGDPDTATAVALQHLQRAVRAGTLEARFTVKDA